MAKCQERFMRAMSVAALFWAVGQFISQAEAQTQTTPKKWVEPNKSCPQICQFRHGPGSRNQYSLCVANCEAYRIRMRNR
jgi:hypothetical protein